jgi:HB1, ASXL, restriction endonuclease HTH domain
MERAHEALDGNEEDSMTKLTTKQAIENVLAGKRNPMTVAEIADAALPLTNLGGKTPKQTFYSVLYAENKKSDGLVVKAGKGGTFKLNPKRRKADKATNGTADAPASAEASS